MAVFPSTPEFHELKSQLEAIITEEAVLYRSILSGTSGLAPAEIADAIDDVGSRKMAVWNKMLDLRLDKD